jgi:hypothetical protein
MLLFPQPHEQRTGCASGGRSFPPAIRRSSSMWLSLLDNLERVLNFTDADPAALVAGLQAVRD